MYRSTLLAAALSALAGCSGEQLLHGLDEAQANEVLLALDEAGLRGTKAREDGLEGRWAVGVASGDAPHARRVLAERALPRARPAGFGEVFGKGSMVPTPTEEHALYLHALGGELARTVEAMDGVVEARVHLGLPQPDPLRPGERAPPRAALLVKCRPASCAAIRDLEGGLRALVAGAADGLDAAAVSVVVAEAAAAPPPQVAPRRTRSPVLVGLAAIAGLAAVAVGATGIQARLRRGRAAPNPEDEG